MLAPGLETNKRSATRSVLYRGVLFVTPSSLLLVMADTRISNGLSEMVAIIGGPVGFNNALLITGFGERGEAL